MAVLSPNNLADTKAVILSVAGLLLTEAEKSLFAETQPLGFILFKRNCDNPEQLRTLTDDLRESVGWDCPVLIDQEGGRVQRLGPPHWKKYQSAKHFGELMREDSHEAEDSLIETTQMIARELSAAGIDVNCAPVLDVLCDDTHDAIGDRAFSKDADIVFRLGRDVCATYLKEGITPVIKHIPGQGRSAQDSHYDLPVVAAPLPELERRDFAPFRRMMAEEIAPQLWGMVSHIIYSAVDEADPASVSAPVIRLIRETLDFNGLLLSDDLSMQALDKYGDVADRTRKTLESGADVALYCAGKLEEMEKVAAAAPKLRPESLERYERSLIRRRSAA